MSAFHDLDVPDLTDVDPALAVIARDRVIARATDDGDRDELLSMLGLDAA